MHFVLLVHGASPAAGVAIRLHDPSDATTLRRVDGGLTITDGPFAELPEPITGFERIEAADLDAAIAVAARHPAAAAGTVEVREIRADSAADDEPAPTPAPGTRRYLFLHTNPTDRTALARTADEPPSDWFTSEHTRRAVLEGERLRPAGATTAATVRLRDGDALIAHGPYAELAEEVAGYDLVAVVDLDEAIALARPHPTLVVGAIEIRPLWTT
ncbi:MAG: YciI family protein [Amnibacterium sp.]